MSLIKKQYFFLILSLRGWQPW